MAITLDSTPPSTNTRPPQLVRRRRRVSIAEAVRWLHIYFSMFALATILFFSVTGITLNHPTWFGVGQVQTVDGQDSLDATWLGPATGNESDQGSDGTSGVDRLRIAEHLREKHNLRGVVKEFRIDEQECSVGFKGPAYAADFVIERETGKYQWSVMEHGAVAWINDLHKGRDTGRAWIWVIDISAFLMAFSSATGLVLLLYLRRRRMAGLLTALVGTVVLIAIVLWFVP